MGGGDALPVATHERTGVLVLRVWTETDKTDGVRARITTDGERTGRQTYVAGGSVEDVVGLVRHWVLAFLAQSAAETDGR